MRTINEAQLHRALDYWTRDAKANPDKYECTTDDDYGKVVSEYLIDLVEDGKC